MELKDIDLNNIDLFVNGDPRAAWKILREQAPVHWHHKDNTGYWSITRHQDALRLPQSAHVQFRAGWGRAQLRPYR